MKRTIYRDNLKNGDFSKSVFLNFFQSAMAILLAIPIAGYSEMIAYSPSFSGQPLIFHINSMELSQFSAVSWAQLENSLLIQSSYANHFDELFYRKCCGGWNLWADGMGQWLHQEGDSQQQFGYRDFTGGFTLGADNCYKNFLVGVAFSYTNTSLDWEQSAGNSQINSYYGGFYGGWNNNLLYVNASAIGTFSDYQTSRHLQIGASNYYANAHHSGGEALVDVEFGAMLEKLFRGIDLVPFLSVDYVYLSQQGYGETDAGNSNLYVENHNDHLLQSEVGLQFIRRLSWGDWIIAPDLSLSYINQTPLTGNSYEVTVISLSHEFTVDGGNFERNLGALGFCLNFIDCKGITSFALRYDGQYGGNYWTQTGSITFNLSF